jgi:predicted Rossmann fold nucleotide-binding protein DprA/Smf involved in DNA uptake
MNFIHLDQSNPFYPNVMWVHLNEQAPKFIAAFGNLEVLKQPKSAIFCSSACPDELSGRTDELVRNLAEAEVAFIGGFQSPVEQSCLHSFLSGTRPIIICPARSLTKMRVRSECKDALERGSLLFLSIFRAHRHRGDIQMALKRNRFVALLADRIFVPYAAPSSKTEQLCREIISWGKSVDTFDHAANDNLVALGARPLTRGEVVKMINASR